MQFNQTNNNNGDVNNAITEKGNVTQITGGSSTGDEIHVSAENGNAVVTTGNDNRVQVDKPKDGFWGALWKKIKGLWTGLCG